MNRLQARHWVIARRVVLILIVLIVGYRSYGDSVRNWLRGPVPQIDLVITQSEFRPGGDGERPLWFMGLRNTSATATYDRILIEATYTDASGRVTEADRIVVNQRLAPGEEQFVGSRDAAPRDGAASGTLKILDAEVVE